MKTLSILFCLAAAALNLSAAAKKAAPVVPPLLPGDTLASNYFRVETERLAQRCRTLLKTPADFDARRPELRRQAAEMLGLSPERPRTDLQAVVTGKLEQETFTVEKLHFQSSPGLYVTANLYVPKHLKQPAPTVLYLSGHSVVVSNGVSYGNKVGYQHHGIWYARNGYVCMIIDTVQLGEIAGHHHGTYKEGMWWWNSRGYSPSAIEVWDGIRALDYLCTRPEVDTNRFAVTGRSGGGAYSWTVAAMDERIKAAAPTAGITDLQNYVVDNCIEGHCDCMFMVNTYRWDYPMLAALIAPRPLLLVNTDSDRIFPLDGVVRTRDLVNEVYKFYRRADDFGLVIGPGPHKDTQNLQVPVFRWFNQHLKHEDPLIDLAAEKLFTPQQLRVFDTLPADELNTKIHELWSPKAEAPAISGPSQWGEQRENWLRGLRRKVFAGWPDNPGPVEPRLAFSTKADGLLCQAYDYESQPEVPLRVYVVSRSGKASQVTLRVSDGAALANPAGLSANARLTEVPAAFGVASVKELEGALGKNSALACVVPRGLGLTAWGGDEKHKTHLRRRYMLLGQTLDSMRVWDIRRALETVPRLKGFEKAAVTLEARGDLAVNALYAAIFSTHCQQLELWNVPASHLQGPDYLNVLQVLDIPQAAALAAERCPVRLHQAAPAAWAYPASVARALAWPAGRLVIAE